jgi:hypothetical protein
VAGQCVDGGRAAGDGPAPRIRPPLTTPTFKPRLRSVPRKSDPTSSSLRRSSLRLVSSMRCSWASVFTCTGLNRPTRIICAINIGREPVETFDAHRTAADAERDPERCSFGQELLQKDGSRWALHGEPCWPHRKPSSRRMMDCGWPNCLESCFTDNP